MSRERQRRQTDRQTDRERQTEREICILLFYLHKYI